MSGIVKSLFGSNSQEKLLKKQQRDLDAVEAGQRRLREGGRGLLAFIDEKMGGGGQRQTTRTFGGIS